MDDGDRHGSWGDQLWRIFLESDEPWVLLRPVRDAAGQVVDFAYSAATRGAVDALDRGPLVGARMLDVAPTATASFEAFRDALESGTRRTLLMPHVLTPRTDDLPGWAALDVRPGHELVAVQWRDVSEERARAAALERSDARLAALLEHAGEVIYVLSADGTQLLYQSPSARHVLGRVTVRSGQPDQVHPDDQEEAWAVFADLMSRPPGSMVEHEVRIEHADGRWIWVHMRIVNRVEDPDVGGVVVNLWDVTNQRELAEELRRQALHDPLTGLPNRRMIDAELDRALADVPATDGCLGLIMCDVDHFRSVNDALGHGAGDELLVQVAERLRASARPGDLVGRLSGDEFLLLCEGLRGPADLEVMAARLHRRLRGRYVVAGQELSVTVTLGGSCTAEAIPASEALRRTDTALSEAKRAGRDTTRVFDQRLHRLTLDRARRHQALRDAIAEDQLVLHYQPKIDLRSGSVVGAEALVRWQHPTDGLLPPIDFLPLAETSSLIVDLGTWVMRRAMADAAGWLTPGSPVERRAPLVAINVSTRHLAHPALPGQLEAALEASGLDPCQVELEVTETSVLEDLDQTARVLETVRDRGMSIALDDFGTGYSSLTWLQRLPVDAVKLDRSFVADLASAGGRTPDIIGSVAALAHALGQQVVAEGVETREQHDHLVELGCDLAQGYLYGRPRPADPFADAEQA